MQHAEMVAQQAEEHTMKCLRWKLRESGINSGMWSRGVMVQIPNPLVSLNSRPFLGPAISWGGKRSFGVP